MPHQHHWRGTGITGTADLPARAEQVPDFLPTLGSRADALMSSG